MHVWEETEDVFLFTACVVPVQNSCVSFFVRAPYEVVGLKSNFNPRLSAKALMTMGSIPVKVGAWRYGGLPTPAATRTLDSKGLPGKDS